MTNPTPTPLSLAQETLWFIDQLTPGQSTYNAPMAYRLRGPLDVAGLKHSLSAVVARHAVLRTRYPQLNGAGVQVVDPPAEIDLPVVDLSQLPADRRWSEVRRHVVALTRPAFDLARGPMVRALLMVLGEEDHLLQLTLHHISIDGPSTAIFIRELVGGYEAWCSGEADPLPPLSLQYADFARWQREFAASPAGRAQLGYWREQLRDLPALELPYDRPRPAEPTGAGAVTRRQMPAALATALNDVSKEFGATPFMVMLAGFQCLLHRYSGSADIAVGSPFGGRSDPRFEPLIGFFTNMFVARCRFEGDPDFAAVVAQVRDTVLDALDHQDVPFSQVVAELRPTRAMNENPLFRVSFQSERPLIDDPHMGDLSLELVDLDEMTSARFDLAMMTMETPAGLVVEVEYSTELFERETIDQLLLHLERLWTAVSTDPGIRMSGLRLLSESEAQEIRRCGSGPSRTGLQPQPRVHDLIRQQARRTPERVAVRSGDRQLTYGALEERAEQVAAALRELGAGPERVVAVAMPRTVELLVALLGVLKSGAAYLPLDTEHPPERLATIVDETDPVALLTTAESAGRILPDGRPRLLVEDIHRRPKLAPGAPSCPDAAPADEDHLAYVIYTSGSTGRPKGVAVGHAAMANLIHSMREIPGLGPDDRLLAITAISFDVHVAELFGPLSVGAEVILAAREDVRDPEALGALLARHRPTLLHATPSLWQVLLASDVDLTGLRALTGGERLTVELAQDLAKSAAEVHNMYGPSETTVWSTTTPVQPGPASRPSLGPPITGTGVYVLDRYLCPVPARVPGELYIAGTGLARGYWNRPALTADRYVADPYGPPGTRMYRTGDLVRWTADGRLDFLGRADNQVKIRGFRVELGEIEACIVRMEQVADAVVLVREDTPGDQRLVAYLVLAAGDEAAPAARTPAELSAMVRDRLGRQLPTYMVPAAVVVLPELPLTVSGKLDRQRLPAPALALRTNNRSAAADAGPDDDGARDLREDVLCELMAGVLGVEDVAVDDDFFSLGGHSLLVVTLVARIRAALGVAPSVSAVFARPTVAGIAATLDETAAGAHRRPGPVRRPDPLPLSFSQLRLWLVAQIEGPSPLYNNTMLLHLSGGLDPEALESALRDLTERHEVLRTVFCGTAAEPAQTVLDPPVAIALERVRLDTGMDPADGAGWEHRARQLIAESAERPFDLARDLPLRARLISKPDNSAHLLALTVHHIAIDGGSMAPLWGDLATAYAARLHGRRPDWKPLPFQYADYSVWQRQLLDADDRHPGSATAQLAYWREVLAGSPAELDLPYERSPDPGDPRRGGLVVTEVGAGVHARLIEIARSTRTSLFMVLHGLLAALLDRVGAGPDVVVGTPVSGRDDEGMADLVGFFVNTLVLRVDTSADPSFTELLRRVRAADLGAFAHQSLPFERLVEALNPVRSAGRNPLFQIMLVMDVADDVAFELPGVEVTPRAWEPGTARFDLTFFFAERRTRAGRPDGLNLRIEYAADRFARPTVARLGQLLVRLAEAVAADPGAPIGASTLMEADDLAQLRRWSVGTRAEDTPASVIERFEQRVVSAPDAVALEVGTRSVRYADLNRRANRVARGLIARGIGPEQVVAVLLPRSVELMATILGVLKAGAAYLPLDPGEPTERLRAVLDEAGVEIVVTDSDLAATIGANGRRATARLSVLTDDDWPGDDPAAEHGGFHRNPAPDERTAPLQPAHPAYVIFTSGSSGQPKGVVIEHRQLADYLAFSAEAYAAARDSCLVPSSIAFDLTVSGLFTPLVTGGRARLATLDQAGDAMPYAFLKATPSQLALLDTLPADRSPTAELVLGGEALTGEALARWRRAHPAAVVYNAYGPTEATVNVTQYRIAPGQIVSSGPVPIGRPLPGARVHVLDDRLRPVPPGVVGDLYLAGAGLARGYLNRPALTAERFVADPFGPPGARMYRSGDRARWTHDGQLVFHGRRDDQVKIRGFRVEPGEVEAALRRHPAVAQAVVRPRPGPDGSQRLVAFVVPAQGAALPSAEELRAHLSSLVPDYLMPAAYIGLDRLPLTVNGKLDQTALPAVPELAPQPAGRPPRTAREILLCGLFADVLGVAAVSADDDFFALGGHSLSASVLVNLLRRRLGCDLGIRNLFAAPTPATLAELLDEDVDRDSLSVVLPLRPGDARPALFCVHPAGGLAWCYSTLLGGLPFDQPVHGLQARSVVPGQPPAASVAAMAEEYIERILETQPAGPYHLLGWSFGGVVAHAIAVGLQARGESVGLLCLCDAYPGHERGTADERDQEAGDRRALAVIAEALGRVGDDVTELRASELDALRRTYAVNRDLISRHVPSRYRGEMLFARAAEGPSPGSRSAHEAWEPFVDGPIDIVAVQADHHRLFEPGPARQIAGLLSERLGWR